ncbi:MAG TPA: SRPBCC domain-containing protein [Longimicrobium sp.]|nr:SRPBCC domain-containing protein [Longimicrobium sp.]
MTTTADPSAATTFELSGDREAVMTRTFAAPRELVWRAITEPAHFARWWGPRGYTCNVKEMDVRPGGRWEAEQTAPSGHVHRFRGEYLEVAPPEKLVHTQRYLEYPPLEVTITLHEHDGQTTLRSVTRFDTPESRAATLQAGMEWGARQSIDRLAELLETL